MEPITFFTGVIISRLLAPVVKDGWKKITNAEAKDEEKRIKRVQEDVANKLMLQRQSHEDRLKEAEKAHELSMKLWEQKLITKGAGHSETHLRCRYAVRYPTTRIFSGAM